MKLDNYMTCLGTSSKLSILKEFLDTQLLVQLTPFKPTKQQPVSLKMANIGMSYGAIYSDTDVSVLQETQFTRMPRGPHSPQRQFEANH